MLSLIGQHKEKSPESRTKANADLVGLSQPQESLNRMLFSSISIGTCQNSNLLTVQDRMEMEDAVVVTHQKPCYM